MVVGKLFAVTLVAFVARSGPDTPPVPGRDEIPTDLPGEVRAAIQGTFADDPEQRQHALVALQEMGPPAVPAVPFLIRFLDVHRDTEGPQSIDFVVSRHWIEQIGEPSVEHLLPHLRSTNRNRRVHVTELLAKIGSPRASEALMAALADEDSEVRAWAACAFRRINDPRVVKPLLAILGNEDEDPVTRSQAAMTLGRYKSPLALKLLLAASKDNSEEVRIGAVRGIGHLQDERATEALMAVFDNRNETLEVRRQAVQALVDTEDPRAIRRAIRAFEDQQEEHLVRLWALNALGLSRNATAYRRVIAAVRETGDLHWGQEEALRLLAQGLHTDDALLVEETEITAPALKDPSVVPPLIDASKDKTLRPGARGDAVHALGKTGDTRAVQPLIAVLNDEQEDKYVRAAAAKALGRINHPRATHALKSALGDKEPHVASAAKEALRKLRVTSDTRSPSDGPC